jgi:hypothetical protein
MKASGVILGLAGLVLLVLLASGWHFGRELLDTECLIGELLCRSKLR